MGAPMIDHLRKELDKVQARLDVLNKLDAAFHVAISSIALLEKHDATNLRTPHGSVINMIDPLKTSAANLTAQISKLQSQK